MFSRSRIREYSEHAGRQPKSQEYGDFQPHADQNMNHWRKTRRLFLLLGVAAFVRFRIFLVVILRELRLIDAIDFVPWISQR